ncbi:hypothetical protein PoB_006560400 [Plakobranchus ocellatus]|uniref:Uncharacterized protein n=1 Tax=Plakobranchus ocellatus TaxID=259542 RepID=A0AAV4D4K3_9GAST|nr:hypothetical protein PoB_006560400 [Plakobranchus ocellatus]
MMTSLREGRAGWGGRSERERPTQSSAVLTKLPSRICSSPFPYPPPLILPRQDSGTHTHTHNSHTPTHTHNVMPAPRSGRAKPEHRQW